MQIEISFIIYEREHHNLIKNDDLYRIRRGIAYMFENSEFGMTQELGDSHFSNSFIEPTFDEYSNTLDELYLSYSIQLPLTHGNLGSLLLHGIPELHRWMNENFPTLTISSRVVYN